MIIDATGWEHEPIPWAARAACLGMNPELWFPERGGGTNNAKAVCAGCPVSAECLAYAIRWDIRFGVWGGQSERARRRLARSRRGPRPRKILPRHGTTARYAKDCRCPECTFAQQQYVEEWRELQQATTAAVR